DDEQAIDGAPTRAEPRADGERGERQADRSAEKHRCERELGRGTERCGDAAGGRHARAAQRLAEIEVREAAEKACVLHKKRLVEMELVAQRCELGSVRLIAEDEKRRIARKQA